MPHTLALASLVNGCDTGTNNCKLLNGLGALAEYWMYLNNRECLIHPMEMTNLPLRTNGRIALVLISRVEEQ